MDLDLELEIIDKKQREEAERNDRIIRLMCKVNNARKELQKAEDTYSRLQQETITVSNELDKVKIELLNEKAIVDSLTRQVAEQEIIKINASENLEEKRQRFNTNMKEFLQTKECTPNKIINPPVINRNVKNDLLYLKGEVDALEFYVKSQKEKIKKVEEFLHLNP